MYNVDELVKDLLGKSLTLCRDYPSILKWSVEKIEKWCEVWTDYTITDPGILFVNADAFLYDVVNYSLDETYLNNVLRYSKSMQSLYAMSKFDGLDFPAYNCSIAKVKVVNQSDYPLVIPKDFVIYVRDSATTQSIYFNSLEELYVSRRTSVFGKFIEGKRGVIDTTFEVFYNNHNFEFSIPIQDIGLNSIFVYAEYDFPDVEGEYLSSDPTLRKLLKVDDALLNLADEPCYSVYYAYNKVVVQLCPGIGDFLDLDSRIKIIYGETFGLSANVGQVNARPTEQIFYESINITSSIKFEIQYASGATIPYDLEETRVFIGNNVWRPETLVINPDFDNLMSAQFSEIVRFTVIQEKGSEEMLVYYVPSLTDSEGNSMSDQRVEELETEIYDYSKDLMFGTVSLKLVRSDEVEKDFSMVVYLNINTSNTDEIYNAIKIVLESYFDRTKQPRNFYLRRGHAIALVEDGVKEIYTIDLKEPVTDEQAKDNELFKLGNLIVTFKQKDDYEIMV